MWSPRHANSVRQKMELNVCEVCASYDVPTYGNIQNPIQIGTYIYDFN